MSTHLKEHLETLKALTSEAKTEQDIAELVSVIKTFSANHSYKKKQPVLLSFALLSAIGFFASFILYPDGFLHFWLGLGSLILFASFFTRARESKNTGDAIAQRAIEIKNGLTWVAVDDRKLWFELKQKFPIFRAGDESQRISAFYQGLTPDGVPFSLFKFTYVDVREEEETDSDGNTSKKTTKTTHHVYGALSNIPNLSGLAINSKMYKQKWDSTSRKFNKKFRVSCENEMVPAKLFTPPVILMFEDQFIQLKNMQTANSEQCFIFSNKIIPATHIKGSIKKTERFICQLENPPVIAELETAKELLDFLNSKFNKTYKEVG